jgi:hypothetical protein
MNKRNLQNKELDRIGRRLLDAARVQSEEIEQIVDSPMLFEAVKARIENERNVENSKNLFPNRANVQIWKWQNAFAMFLFLFVASVIGVIVFGKFAANQQIEQTTVQESKYKAEPVEIKSAPMVKQTPENSAKFVKTTISVNETPKVIKEKLFINKAKNPKKFEAKKPEQPQHKIQPKQSELQGEFYALTFAGNPVEKGEEVQIVRAELSRSSLFALGVNLPIENESEKIKTDLLVGADGVTRAIRLVSKAENQ